MGNQRKCLGTLNEAPGAGYRPAIPSGSNSACSPRYGPERVKNGPYLGGGPHGHFWVKKSIFSKYLKTDGESKEMSRDLNEAPGAGYRPAIASGSNSACSPRYGPKGSKMGHTGGHRAIFGSKNRFFQNISKLMGNQRKCLGTLNEAPGAGYRPGKAMGSNSSSSPGSGPKGLPYFRATKNHEESRRITKNNDFFFDSSMRCFPPLSMGPIGLYKAQMRSKNWPLVDGGPRAASATFEIYAGIILNRSNGKRHN